MDLTSHHEAVLSGKRVLGLVSSGKVRIILRNFFFFNRTSKAHIFDLSFAPDPLPHESKESPDHLDARQLLG